MLFFSPVEPLRSLEKEIKKKKKTNNIEITVFIVVIRASDDYIRFVTVYLTYAEIGF